MASHKRDEFSLKENELASFAKALSHPARIAILKTIAEHDTCICGEIVSVLPLAQATVSQHLKELLKADLIKGTVDGPKSCYCINWKTFKKFSESFNTFFNKAKAMNDSCC